MSFHSVCIRRKTLISQTRKHTGLFPMYHQPGVCMLLTLWSFPCVTEPEHGCGAKHGKLARRAGRLLAAAAWICSIKRLWNCLVERWDSKASCEAAAWKVGKNAKILKVRGKSKAFCPLFVITGTPGICVLSPSQGCVNQI